VISNATKGLLIKKSEFDFDSLALRNSIVPIGMLARSFRRFAGQAFNLTEAAAAQVKQILQGDYENKMMRINLAGGGCAGLRYEFSFESKAEKGDQVFGKDGAQVVLNKHAMVYLNGATLDFVSDRFNCSFKIDLPENAPAHSCRCGRSDESEIGATHC
jgi:iron-sulfur cluster assembly accessory protein